MEALILNIACEFVGSYNVETVGLYTTAASTGNIDIDYCIRKNLCKHCLYIYIKTIPSSSLHRWDIGPILALDRYIG